MYCCHSILECYDMFSGVKLSIRSFCCSFFERLYSYAPCITGIKQFTTADLVKSDIPLLLRKEDMKPFCVKIDMPNDTAGILGRMNVDTK